MSRGFIKEGDQEEIPMVPPRAYLPEGVPNYVTKEGFDALKEELKNLEAERVKAGDNYIMRNLIDATIKLLVARINSAVEVDLSKAKKDTVSFGAWVRYNGRVVRIVGVDEADVNKGLISFISPIAKSLIGKKAGDIIELKGSAKIEVEEVSFAPLTLTQIVQDKPVVTMATTERRKPETLEQEPVQIVQEQPIVEDQDKGLPAPADEPRRFEPEENPIEFLPIVNERGNIMGRAMYVELQQRKQDAASCCASACYQWKGRNNKTLLVACGVWRHARENPQAKDGGNTGPVGNEPEVEEAIYKRLQDRKGACLRFHGCFRRRVAHSP